MTKFCVINSRILVITRYALLVLLLLLFHIMWLFSCHNSIVLCTLIIIFWFLLLFLWFYLRWTAIWWGPLSLFLLFLIFTTALTRFTFTSLLLLLLSLLAHDLIFLVTFLITISFLCFKILFELLENFFVVFKIVQKHCLETSWLNQWIFLYK